MSKLVARAKKKRWFKRQRICEGCADPYYAVSSTQRFCGSVTKKHSCSYMNRQRQWRAWRKKNKAKVAQFHRNWTKAHHARQLAQQRLSYEKNRVARLLKLKRYYQKNKEKAAERKRQYRLKGRQLTLQYGKAIG